jgi:hypothetical protein
MVNRGALLAEERTEGGTRLFRRETVELLAAARAQRRSSAEVCK